MKSNFNSVLHNQYVLYLFVFMTIVDLMVFASVGDIRSLLTLLIIGFLTSFFSKNMIVILFTTLVFTHILKYGTRVSEGLENQDLDLSDIMDNSGNIVDKKDTKEDNTTKTVEGATDKTKTDAESAATLASLRSELSDFQAIQDKILGGMREIDPLLTKAESFIDKFEKYKLSEKMKNKPEDE